MMETNNKPQGGTMQKLHRFSSLYIFVLALGLPATQLANALDKQSEPYRATVCKHVPNEKACNAVRPSHTHYSEAPIGSVEREDGVTITVKNGKKIEFKNIQKPGLDPQEAYSFVGFLPQHQYFVVIGTFNYGEDFGYVFVSNLTGETYRLFGDPILSPDGKHVFVIPRKHGGISTAGDLYKFGTQGLSMVAKLEFGNCPSSHPPKCPDINSAVWISPNEVVAFSLEYTKPPERVVGEFLVRIFYSEDKGWSVQRISRK
jgi:hypothetical protein